MKKILVALSALFLAFACCKKKDEVKPALGYGSDTTTIRLPQAVAQYSSGSANYLDEVTAAINASGITITKVSDEAVILSNGDEKVLLESENGEIFVSNAVSTNGRISKTPLKVAGAKNGGFYGITIYINSGNYKEIVKWFSDKNNNPFKLLFGQETYDILFGATTPGSSYVFAPKLNVNKLPKGAYETSGTLSAKKEGTLSGAQIGSKVSVTGDSPGTFGFYMDEQSYVESGAYSLLLTTKLTDKDYVIADGTKYPGSKSGKTSSFVFMLGLGKGQNNPPMSGILIGFAAAPKATSAMMFIGIFSGLKVK